MRDFNTPRPHSRQYSSKVSLPDLGWLWLESVSEKIWFRCLTLITMFTFQAPSPRCHLHKSLYQSPFTQAPSPEYTVSGDYRSGAAGGSAKGRPRAWPLPECTVIRIYCLNDQTSHFKSRSMSHGGQNLLPLWDWNHRTEHICSHDPHRGPDFLPLWEYSRSSIVLLIFPNSLNEFRRSFPVFFQSSLSDIKSTSFLFS